MKIVFSRTYITRTLAVVALSAVLFGAIVYADEVQLSSDIPIILTIGTENVTFTMRGSALTEFTVLASSIGITTGANESVELWGPTSISFGEATDCTQPGYSKYIIPQNSNVMVTPLKPASTEAEYKNTCDGRTATGSSSSTATTATAQLSGQQQEEKIEFKDVPGKGKKKLTPKYSDAITQMAQLMLDKKTYKFPNNKKYYPYNKTSAYLTIQMALAVKGVSCEWGVSVNSCVAAITKAGILSEDSKLSKYPTRAEFYAMLLKAAGIKLLEPAEITKKLLCKDLAADSPNIQVLATARKYKIASVYTNGKCNANKFFYKYEAAMFAARALTAKQNLAK